MFLALAFACFIVMLLVAGAVITFAANWAVWEAAGFIALCLHWWFGVEL